MMLWREFRSLIVLLNRHASRPREFRCLSVHNVTESLGPAGDFGRQCERIIHPVKLSGQCQLPSRGTEARNRERIGSSGSGKGTPTTGLSVTVSVHVAETFIPPFNWPVTPIFFEAAAKAICDATSTMPTIARTRYIVIPLILRHNANNLRTAHSGSNQKNRDLAFAMPIEISGKNLGFQGNCKRLL